MTNTPTAAEAADQLRTLLRAASARLDSTMRVNESRRHANLIQFNALRDRAERDSTVVVNDPARLADDSVLWQLREPGFLRGVCEYPVPAPRGWFMMLPVLIAWSFLGFAELWYRDRLVADPASVSGGFFAAWTKGPVLLGPAAMAAAVVVSIALIIRQYMVHGRAVATADRVDAIAHRLEVDIDPYLETLCATVPPAGSEDITKSAALDLRSAADRFSAAAGTIDVSMKGLRRLSDIAERLAAVGPALGQHVDGLQTVSRELVDATARIGIEGQALKAAVDTTFTASNNARKAGEAAENAAAETVSLAKRVDRAEETIVARVIDMERINAPFVQTAQSVSETAAALHEVVTVVRAVAGELNRAVDQANWIALIADGMHNPGDETRAARS